MPVFDICDRCGAIIQDDEVRFKVRIMAMADDGEIISEPVSDEDIESLIAGFEDISPDNITQHVFEERIYILCRDCKSAFMQKPFRVNLDDSQDNQNRVFH